MSRSPFLLRTPAAVTALLLSAAFSQIAPAQDTPVGGSTSRTQPGTSGMNNETDRIVATWAQSGARCYLEVAQIGAQRATNPQVKSFAQNILQEHQQCLQKLSSISGTHAGAVGMGTQPGTGRDPSTGGIGRDPSLGGTGRDPSTGGTGRGVAEASGTRERGTTGTGGDIDHAQLIQEMTEKHVQTSRQMLQQKSGDEFDKAFLGMALMGAAYGADTLQVLEKHASPELKQALQQEVQRLQQDKQRAESLMQQIAGSPARDHGMGGDKGMGNQPGRNEPGKTDPNRGK